MGNWHHHPPQKKTDVEEKTKIQKATFFVNGPLFRQNTSAFLGESFALLQTKPKNLYAINYYPVTILQIALPLES